MKLTFFFLLLAGCSSYSKKEFQPYKLQNGEKVFCENAEIFNCGMTLWNCKEEGVYYCQVNVEEL